jgi:L-aminopeptidase/D-esterase-like protein
MPFISGGLTSISGLKVGHWSDLESGTGCTVVLCPPDGAVGGVDVRGPAPATRETDLLRPGHLVERVNAVLLTGGSAFGLDAAAGVVRFLQEQGIGYDAGAARVPIVPAAAIFDLSFGNAGVRPTADAGYRACLAATASESAEGNVGAGTGATVGHLLGPTQVTKGGLGTAAYRIQDGPVVAALVVVNAFGDVVDPTTGAILAGTRRFDGGWLDSGKALLEGIPDLSEPPARTNTTIGVVATDVALTKEQANLVAMMAHDGYARAIEPAHTLYDGDAIFVLSTGARVADVTTVGHAAALVVARAITRAAEAATSLCEIPGRRDWAREY